MLLQRSIIVQPCYSLEDLTRNLNESSALDYHAAWTSLWHPQILSAIGSLPEWKRSDSASLDVLNALIVVPIASKSQIDTTLRERIYLNENVIVESLGTRQANVVAIATLLGIAGDTVIWSAPADGLDEKGRSPVSVDTFFALGFAFQQLNILTRKVHYSTNLDLILFYEQVEKSSQAFCNGDHRSSEMWLQSCFDQLSQERDRYFSQQANLIDLTLLAKSTLGDTLSRQLKASRKQNILASASMIQRVMEQNTTAAAEIQTRLQAKSLSVIGGLDHESASAWLSSDHLLRSLSRGKNAYAQSIGYAPKIFARLTGGMLASDAQLLRISGFSYAVLSGWLDGGMPTSDQAKIRWQSADTSTIDAINAFVLQASSALSVLSVAMEFAKQFDYHQVPTLLLAHWPNEDCEPFSDLILATQRTTALGSWQTLDDYFETTGQAYSNTSLASTKFDYPLPSHAKRLHSFCQELATVSRLHHRVRELGNLCQLNENLGKWLKRNSLVQASDSLQHALVKLQLEFDVWSASTLNAYRSSIAEQAVGSIASTYTLDDLIAEYQSLLNQTVILLSQLISGTSSITGKRICNSELMQSATIVTNASSAVADTTTIYIINPLCSAMRYYLRTGANHFTCAQADRIYGHDNTTSASRLLQSMNSYSTGGNESIVDVPAGGVVQLKKSSASMSTILRRSMLATSTVGLSNEYLDVQLDAKTGNIRSMLISRKRGSRMSGQLSIANVTSLAGATSATTSRYAAVRNVKLSIEHNSTVSAIIVARGLLIVDEKDIAKFEIQYELWRGSRCLQITPAIDWLTELKDDRSTWDVAPVWRTAWPNDSASVRVWQHEIPVKSTAANIFSPCVMEIDDAEHKLYLMNSGTCLHKRYESRYLDTHLGSGRGVTLLVGLDVLNPLEQWASWVSGPLIFYYMPPIANDQNSISFWSSSQSGLMVDWLDRTIFVQDSLAPTHEFDAYFKVQETIGRAGTAEIRFFRDVKDASRVNCVGGSDEIFSVVSGECLVPVRSSETILIGVNWA